MMMHTIAQYAEHLHPICLKRGLSNKKLRSGAGMAGAQSLHANVYATQVSTTQAAPRSRS